MFNLIKPDVNCFRRILCKINSQYFLKRSRFFTTSASKIIVDAHQTLFTDGDGPVTQDSFLKYSDYLRSCIFSKQEAACALKLCLDFDHFDSHLFRNIVKVLEDEYFKPVLLEDSQDVSHELYNVAGRNVSNTFDFINTLSAKDKSTLVRWVWMVNRDRKKYVRRPKIVKRTEEVDPERREVYITKKTGMVLDPIPIRARLSYIPPGKKLANTLSVQLRESVLGATLPELCHISHIFATPLPLSGQINEDTIDLIASRFCEFDTTDLSRNIFSLSAFCRYASNRFFQVWSFMDPNINRTCTRGSLLYKYETRKLSNRFVNKVLECLGCYISSELHLDNYTPYINLTSDLTVNLYVLNNLANSDIPVSVNVWDKLVSKMHSVENVKAFDIKEIGLFCDSVLKAKITTPNTMDFAKRMLGSMTIKLEYTPDDYYLISQILNFILAHDLAEESSDIIQCVSTLTLNNREKLKFEQEVRLVKYLNKLSHNLNESDRPQLSTRSSELAKENNLFKV